MYLNICGGFYEKCRYIISSSDPNHIPKRSHPLALLISRDRSMAVCMCLVSRSDVA
jgi:hypothetical protein